MNYSPRTPTVLTFHRDGILGSDINIICEAWWFDHSGDKFAIKLDHAESCVFGMYITQGEYFTLHIGDDLKNLYHFKDLQINQTKAAGRYIVELS